MMTELWSLVLLGNAPFADVAPPPGAVVALSLGALIGLGVLVAGVVVVSVLVILWIKRGRVPKDNRNKS
jgi:hypothetical protein